MSISPINFKSETSSPGIYFNNDYDQASYLFQKSQISQEQKELANWGWSVVTEDNSLSQKPPLEENKNKEFIATTKRQAINCFYTLQGFTSVSLDYKRVFAKNLRPELKKEIERLMNSDLIEDMNKLQTICRARDVLIIWKKLQDQVGGNIDLNLEKLNSAEDLIAKAEEFPKWFETHFESLSRIKELKLIGHQLTHLPEEIGCLLGLQRLILMNNQLTSLPPMTLEGKPVMANLWELDLSNNQFTTLPEEIGHLNLWILSLRGNELNSVPSVVCQLKLMGFLDLSGNELTSLPTEMGQWPTRLQRLDISNNRFTMLPSEMGQLTKLDTLVLGGNSIASLPPEMGQLTKLEALQLGNNPITSLPQEMSQLPKLQIFYCSRLNMSLYYGLKALAKLPSDILREFYAARARAKKKV